MTYAETLERDGAVLVKDIFGNDLMNTVRDEYDRMNAKLNNQEIYRNEPLVVFWTHKKGEQKRIARLAEMPAMMRLIKEAVVPFVKDNFGYRIKKLALLETIVFNKPNLPDNTLHWHQDVAYFPLSPNNQLAVWFPLEPVSKEHGALVYALGSHKGGAKGSTDLHTREKFANENRELIPLDPATEGYEVVTMEMSHNDMLVHDGYTWHYSGPNLVEGYVRRGVSVRFITEDVRFDPRPGQGAAFTKQIDVEPGEVLINPAFPVL